MTWSTLEVGDLVRTFVRVDEMHRVVSSADNQVRTGSRPVQTPKLRSSTLWSSRTQSTLETSDPERDGPPCMT
jgi:hypothetical protein